ncbi:MAG: hypothetical protein ACTSQO_03500 [Candidatus Helarchaeota archaeon]
MNISPAFEASPVSVVHAPAITSLKPSPSISPIVNLKWRESPIS